MIRQFRAKVDNENEIANVLMTGLESSKTQGTIFFMSDGTWAQIAHAEYKEELIGEGFWVAGIFEGGHRVDF